MSHDVRVTTNPIERLLGLPNRLESATDFAEVIASLIAGHGATLDGVWGSSRALVTAALAQHAPSTLVVVLPEAAEIDSYLGDLAMFSTAAAVAFPPLETAPGDESFGDEASGQRLRLLKQLATGNQRPRVVMTSIQSLMQRLPTPSDLRDSTRTLHVGELLDLEAFVRWLLARGFTNMTAVELPGEFSHRGGILDLFAIDWDAPVRVELFDDEIESLRRFNVADQRSLATLDEVDVTVVNRVEPSDHLTSYLGDDAWFLLIEPHDIDEAGKAYLNRLEDLQNYHSTASVLREVLRFPSATAAAVATDSLETTCRLKIESVERFSGEIGRVRDELDAVGVGQEVFVIVRSEAEAKRLGELFSETQLMADARLHFPIGRLQAGFRLVVEQTVLIDSNELFHRVDITRPVQRHMGRAIDSFLELRQGDLIVHLAHGIGRYLGLKLLDRGDQVEEHLELEFSGGTKVYVPSTKIELVQKYVGGTKSRPMLAKIGARSWVRQKEKAEQAVTDLAVEMLELQAARASRPGILFPTDTEWQTEFDAAFAYVETKDQLTAIDAIKKDMCEPRPMDRLICGDVGYGKTEVAMRAVFKAVESGYQAAMLVPTTILAEQHGRTLRSRMAEFPFEIAVLSRFRTRKQQRDVIERLGEGAADIVVGTHRLAQSDVKFHNLGLVIIDEEQRFGVQVKDRLKTLRATVDVLTLTATPIPRTLHMSLLGLRDISNLETPPEDRLAVETRVTRFDVDLVRHAILRELNRGGQIYFVHNRIHDIQRVAQRLREIVPEATLAIGHGQMPEGQLQQVMLNFVDHKFDILLATTIIESGLDIPTANTIFIDDADRYGLADLHQLRGRVGRYRHRAYCYLLVDPKRSLNPEAAKRLRAIEEFSHMGAGFAIALRDLEIRGAGNILGTEQSGHIATVGYELYCELLEQAVRRLKRMPPRVLVEVDIDLPGAAYLPRSYVPEMRTKIDLYRRLSRLTTPEQVDDFATELIDRFGPHPVVVDRLLALMRLRIAAARWGIASIHREDDYLVLAFTAAPLIRRLASASGGRLRVVDGRSAYLPLDKGLTDPDALHAELESLLRLE